MSLLPNVSIRIKGGLVHEAGWHLWNMSCSSRSGAFVCMAWELLGAGAGCLKAFATRTRGDADYFSARLFFLSDSCFITLFSLFIFFFVVGFEQRPPGRMLAFPPVFFLFISFILCKRLSPRVESFFFRRVGERWRWRGFVILYE